MITVTSGRKKKNLFIISLLISVVVILSGYVYYKYEEVKIREDKYNTLKAIADLKIKDITEWRGERLSEANFFSKDLLMIENTARLLKDEKSVVLKNYFYKTLSHIVRTHSYENIFIISKKNDLLFSIKTNFNTIDSVTKYFASETFLEKKIIFSDAYFCSTDNTIHYDIYAPIVSKQNTILAVLVFRINPDKFIYPLIREWPLPNKTAETLLIRKEGDYVLFLNDLLFRSNQDMSYKISLTQKEVVAVQAVYGRTGIIEAKDYRGENVLAGVYPVTGTDWIMIAKIDESEIFSELWYRAIIITLFTIISILFLITGVSFVYKYRQSIAYRELLKKEKELRENEEVFRITLYSIGDGVITTDTNGWVKQMNFVAEQLTGRKEAESTGRRIEEVFKIINEDSRLIVENPVERVLREGLIVGLANHTLLISKDGKETPIADSGAPIRNDEGEIIGVVLVFRDQTAERDSKKVLEEREDKLNSIFRSAPVGIGLVINRIIKEVNQQLCEITGYSAEELLEQSSRMLYENDEEYKYVGEEKYRQIAEKGTGTVTTKWIRKNGEIIYVLLSSTPLDINDLSKGVTFTALDITEQKRIENEINKKNSDLAALLDTSLALVETLDLTKVLQKITDSSVSLLGLDTSAIYILKNNELLLGATSPPLPENFPDEFRKALLENHMHIKKCIGEKSILTIADTHSEKLSKEEQIITETNNMRSLLYLPLFVESEALGVLILGSVGKVHKFSEEEINLCRTLSSQAAMALSNSILFEKTNDDLAKLEILINERKVAEEALRQSENRYRNLFENHAAVKLIIEPETGNILEANHAAAEFYGYTKEQLTSMSIQKINILSEEEIKKEIAKAKSNQKIFFDFKHKTADGSIREVEVFTSIIESNGKQYLHSIIHDVTESKIAKDALKQSEEDYKTLFNQAHDPIIVFLPENEIIMDVNNRACEVYGYTKDELIGMSLEKVSKNVDTGKEKINKVLSEGSFYGFETQQFRKDGSELIIEVNATIINYKNQKAILSINRDITERKRTEKLIQVNEERLRLAMNAGGLGLFDIDTATGNAITNNIYDINLGYEPGELQESFAKWLKRTHNDDRPKIISVYRKYFSKNQFENNAEIRQRTKSGEWKWFYIIGKAIEFDNDGRPKRIIGLQTDITSRKKTEEALIESEELFRRAFLTSPDSINISRLSDGLFVNINEGFTNTTGFTEKEVIGKTSFEINIWADVESREKLIEGLKYNGYVTNLEANFRMKDGRILTGLLSASLFNLKGVPHILSITRNIEEIKKVQAALIESEQKYRSFFENDLTGDYISNIEGELLSCNQSYADIFGFKSIEEALNTNTKNIYTNDKAREIFLDLVRERKNVINFEYEYKKITGEKLYLIENTRGIFNENNELVQLQGYIFDNTKRKIAELLLKESEEKFKALIDNSSDVILIINREGILKFISPSFEEVTGYKIQEKLGKSVFEDIHPDDLNEVLFQFSKGLQSENKRSPIFEYRYKNKNDEYIYIETIGLSLITNPSINGILINARDITKRKETEQVFRLYEHTIRNISDCVSITDTNNNIIYVNQAFERTYGYTFEEVYQKHISIVAYYDNKILNKVLEETLLSEWKGELINIKKDGTLFPISLSTSKIYDDKNNIIGLVGVATDITERKAAEKQLRESEERFKGLFENAALGIYRGTPDGELLFGNKSLINILGYNSIEDLKKIKATDLYVDMLDRDRFQKEINEKGFVSGFEEKFYKKDKSIISISENARAIKDEKGKILFYEGIIEDITDKKENINLIRLQTELLIKLQSETDLDKILDITLKTIKAIKPIDSGGIYIKEGDDLILKTHSGLSSKFIDQVKVIKKGSYHFDLLKSNEVVFNDYVELPIPKHDPGFKEGLKKIVIVPLFLKDRLIGCINSAVHKEEHITETAHNAIITIGSILSEILARHNAYQELKESEEKFRLVFENEINGFAYHEIILDSKGKPKDYRFVNINKGFERIVQKKAKDIIGKTVLEIWPETEAFWIKTYGEVALKQKSISFENYSESLKKYFHVNAYSPIKGFFAVSFNDITKRVEQEQSIRKLLRAVEQSQVSIVITDTNGIIEYVNPKFEGVTGYKLNEVVGKNPRILKSGETSPEEYRKMWDSLLAGKDWNGEFHNKKKNGELFWESANISPIKNSDGIITNFIAVKEDITEKVKAEEELNNYKVHLEKLVEKRTEQLNETNLQLEEEIKKQKEYDKQLQDQLFMLNTFVESMPTAAFIKDADLKFVEVNHAFEELAGKPKKDIIGKTGSDVFSATVAHELFMQDKEVIEQKKLKTFTMKMEDFNNRERYLLVNKVIFQKSYGEFGGLLGTYIDISEQKKLQESIERSLAKEKELNELKSRFISMASHEFRTPLTSIRIFSDLIEMQKDKNDKEKLSEYIGKIQNSVTYMTDLINDVLTVSRAETGKLKLTTERIDLKSFCDDLLSEIKLNASPNHKLILNYNAKKTTIYADSKLLRYILSNLLSNAAKYSPKGGEIVVDVEIDNSNAVISVKDSGIGMSETVMKNLFEPF